MVGENSLSDGLGRRTHVGQRARDMKALRYIGANDRAESVCDCCNWPGIWWKVNSYA